jgi:hypothetical protein
MNPPVDPDKDSVPPFDDAAQEREWLAQENALRRERLNLDPAGEDERVRQYRELAHTLRAPLPGGLPADFATRVSALATATPVVRFENVALLVLVGALLGAAALVIATHGDEWTPSFGAILPARDTQASVWLMALAGCVGATWLMERWQQRRHR